MGITKKALLTAGAAIALARAKTQFFYCQINRLLIRCDRVGLDSG
jgi:hypothetical protein